MSNTSFECISNLIVNELNNSSVSCQGMDGERQTGALVCCQWSLWVPVCGGTACSALYGCEWSCAHISRCQRCFSQSTAPGSATTAMAEGGEGEDEIQFLRTVSTKTHQAYFCLKRLWKRRKKKKFPSAEKKWDLSLKADELFTGWSSAFVHACFTRNEQLMF